MPGIEVASAGVRALSGQPANPLAVEALARHGIDLGEFRGTQLTADLAAGADWIVTAADVHRQIIVETWPHLAAITRNLLTFTGEDADVDDPLGGTLDDYLACFDRMQPALRQLLQAITTGKDTAPHATT